MNKIFKFMQSKVFVEVFKKCCENLCRWTWKPELKNFVHLILKTRDYVVSVSTFRFLLSIHIKKGSSFEKITEKFGPIWRIWQLKPLCRKLRVPWIFYPWNLLYTNKYTSLRTTDCKKRGELVKLLWTMRDKVKARFKIKVKVIKVNIHLKW